MTGRGRVVVLWDPDVDAPPGPTVDAAVLANAGWEWEYYGPPTAVRPPTMVRASGTSGEAERGLGHADVVVGVPTLWTLDHVARSGCRFVAVHSSSTLPVIDAEADGATVNGWPSPDSWSEAFDEAAAIDVEHLEAIEAARQSAEDVAGGMRDLIEEIQSRHLPESFRRPAH